MLSQIGLLSLSNMHLKFLHVFTWLDSSFLFSTDWYSIVWIYHSLFIWGHLGCFQVLAIMNKAAVNTVCGLPWWLSSKESAFQCRRHGFDLWSGKIPHAVEQLSLGATLLSLSSRAQERNCWVHELRLLKPTCPRACAQSKRSRHNGKPAHCSSRVASTHYTWRKARAAAKAQHSQK